MNKRIIIGTRGSRLALQQTKIVTELLLQQNPSLDIQQTIIKTKGDAVLDVALSKIGDKGLFVKEIESALLENRIDIAVHSMKDLPTESPDELTIAAIPKREDDRDVLVSKNDLPIEKLPQGAVIATSSLRRAAQLLAFRNDFSITDIRGNVETRLRKFQQGNMHGLILAMAGLKRLGLMQHTKQPLPHDILLPAPAQGAIAVQVRKEDKDIYNLVQSINDENSFSAVSAERSFLKELEGGCQTPLAAFCDLIEDQVKIEGKVLNLDGSKCVSGNVTAHKRDAKNAGIQLAHQLLENGAKEILEEIRAKDH